jgi:hydrogenase-4 component E
VNSSFFQVISALDALTGALFLLTGEAVPQLLGLLAVENGVFFAGIAIVPDLPVIAELAAAVDLAVIALVVGLLARSIHRRVGTTAVGGLSALRER